MGIFKYLDATLAEMLPKAEIKFASMVYSGEPLFVTNPFCQQAFISITQLIEERKNIKFDSQGPLRKGHMTRDMTHMRDRESINLWMDVVNRFN